MSLDEALKGLNEAADSFEETVNSGKAMFPMVDLAKSSLVKERIKSFFEDMDHDIFYWRDTILDSDLSTEDEYQALYDGLLHLYYVSSDLTTFIMEKKKERFK